MKKTIKIPKKKFKIYNPKLKEECGVFGVSNNKDSAALTALGLHALQHRGQEGCGIVTFDGKKYYSEKRFGLVGDNFNKEKVLNSLPGDYAIGHNRYSTTGENTLRNIQPFFADTNAGGIGVAHNGNLTNSITLRNRLVQDGAIFHTTSDTETIVQLIAKSKRNKTIDKVIDAIFQIQGGYALVMLTQNTLIGVRDPHGIRPLVIGKIKDSYVFASETCALDIIGAKYIRDVENGEVVYIENNELKSIKPFPAREVRPCVFEYIYFARPDSLLNGKSAYEHRKQFGIELAKENKIKADIVVPVPDSGNAAALGFAQHLGINFELGLIRNHYVGRTFIEPSQKIRSLGVKLKLNANQSTIKVKPLSYGEIQDINRMASTYPQGRVVPRVTWRMEKEILEVDGSRDKAQIAKFIESMPIADSKFIRNFMNENEPRLDMNKTIMTPSGERLTVNVGFGVDFFRPFF